MTVVVLAFARLGSQTFPLSAAVSNLLRLDDGEPLTRRVESDDARFSRMYVELSDMGIGSKNGTSSPSGEPSATECWRRGPSNRCKVAGEDGISHEMPGTAVPELVKA
jgi:hypothetical protein